MSEIDGFDRKILSALQHDGRLTNNELADTIGLSASQCSRRRTRLEKQGYIKNYSAILDKELTGFGLVSIVFITLATHSPNYSARFAKLVLNQPEVQEAHALTGEMDYQLKIVTSDLKALSKFINDVLVPHEAVQNVKTAIVLDTIKETSALPI